jgi:hypothetical protein
MPSDILSILDGSASPRACATSAPLVFQHVLYGCEPGNGILRSGRMLADGISRLVGPSTRGGWRQAATE